MIQLPNNWDGVTIQQWKELNEIQSENPLTRVIEQIAILSDVDPYEIRKMSPIEFNALAGELSFLSNELKPDIKLKFWLDDREWGLIPDLSLISTGEFVDAETWKADPVANIHLLCAMLYRPIIESNEEGWKIEEYKPEGFMKRADLFLKKLPITIPYGAVLFFSTSGIRYTEIIADYLEEELVAAQTKKKTKKKTQRVTKKGN